MGFDVTAANIIFFIAFLTAGSAALGAYWSNSSYVEEARRTEDSLADDIAHTNMTIASTAYNGGADRFTVQIENTGTTVLAISDLSYFINGALLTTASIESTSILNEGTATDLWLPTETLEVRLRPIDPSPTYFQVVAENGVRANWGA